MQLFTRPVLALVTLHIFHHVFAISSLTSPLLNPPSISVLQNQSFQIPLLSIFSSPNISFTTTSTSLNVALINPLQSSFTKNITGGPQASTAFFVNDTYIAYINESFMLFYGSYQQGSDSINLSQVQLEISNSSVCTSIATLRQYLIISCGSLLNSTNNQTQLVILFDTTNATNILNISQVIPFQSVSSPLPSLISATESPTGPVIVVYFDNNTLKGNDAVIVLYNIETLQSNITTIPASQGPAIQTVQAVYDGIYIMDISGTVYYAAWDVNLQIKPLETAANVGGIIVGSCAYNQNFVNPTIAPFSANFLYFIQNSVVALTYSAPNNTSFVSCALDSEFLYTIVKDNASGSLYSVTYSFGTENNGNPLVQLAIGLESILAISAGQTPGETVLLSGNTLSLISVSNPKIQVSNAQQPLEFNVTMNGTSISVPINVSVISNPTQIYQKDSTIPPLYSFGMPTVDLQNLFIGPALGLANGNEIAFTGVYGSCSVSNFANLKLPAYDQLFVKIFPGQPYSSGANILGVLGYTQNRTLTYLNISISSLYSAGTYNTPQVCSSTLQLFTITKIVSFPSQVTRCISGQNYDLCLANQSVFHITPAQGIIFNSTTQQCIDVYLWQQSSYNADVSVCIGSKALFLFNEAGEILTTIPNTVIGGQSFLSAISSNFMFPNLLIVSSSQALVGLQVSLPAVIPTDTLMPDVIFSLEVNVAENSYLQLTQNRLVLIYNTSLILEYDMLEIYSPYLIGNYELFSFQLNLQLRPSYQPIPNHLSVYATDNSIPYLLTFQPGNIATSTLLYATSLENTVFTSISSLYDASNQYTLFFISNSTNMTYFYALNSSYIAFANSSLGTNGCLYCSGTKNVVIGSSIIPSNFVNVSFEYTAISSEQPVSLPQAPPQPVIKSKEPVSGTPSYFFQGTVLDYSITTVTVSSSTAVFLITPLNLSQVLQQTITSGPGSIYTYQQQQQQGQVSLFSDGISLYILQKNGLSSINLNNVPYQIQAITLSSAPGNAVFATGDAYPGGNAVLAYTTGNDWSIYVYPANIYVAVPFGVIQVKIVGTFIFALTTSETNLIYVLNSTSSSLETIMVVQSTIFDLAPISFEVANLQGNTYVALVVDRSDTLYNYIIDVAAKTSAQSVISDFTVLVQSDLPTSSLQIVKVQYANESASQSLALNFVLSVSNFHSYSVQLTYNQTSVQSTSILQCFVQMPGYVTIGQSFITDSYFLDIKQILGTTNYLFSYPLNLTYPTGSGQTGPYSYAKPVARQILTGTSNVQIYATNGQTGAAFTTSGQEGTNSVSIQAFSVSNYLQIGFNPSLSSSTLSTISADQVTLTGSNDYGSVNIQISLDTPVNILNSAYFIAFTAVFTVVFCVACIWFFRRAYYKKKNKNNKTNQEVQRAVGSRNIEEPLIEN